MRIVDWLVAAAALAMPVAAFQDMAMTEALAEAARTYVVEDPLECFELRSHNDGSQENVCPHHAKLRIGQVGAYCRGPS